MEIGFSGPEVGLHPEPESRDWPRGECRTELSLGVHVPIKYLNREYIKAMYILYPYMDPWGL